MPAAPGRTWRQHFKHRQQPRITQTPFHFENTFEGGTNGVTFTSGVGGNTGGTSGQFFDRVVTGSGGTTVFTSSQSWHGTLGGQFSTTGTADFEMFEWDLSGWGSVTGSLPDFQPQLWSRVYVKLPALPTAGTTLELIVLYNFNSRAAMLGVGSDGTIHLGDGGSGFFANGSLVLPTNQWFRVEFYAYGDPTVGQVAYQVWTTSPDAATSPDETLSAAGRNTFGTFARFSTGIAWNDSPATYTVYLDDVGLGNVGWLGPTAGNAVTTTAGVASSSVAAPQPSIAATATAGVASSSAVAPQAVPAVTVTAGVATCAVVANAPVAALAGTPPAATVGAVALQASIAETVTAGVAVIGTVAPQAVPAVTVTAGVAASTAVASQPVPAVTVTAGVAVIGTVAPAPTVAAATQPPAAVIGAVAPQPRAAETVVAGVAIIGVTAPQPTVIGGGTAVAAVAPASVVAPAPVPAVIALAGVAAVAAVAPQPTVASQARAGAAAVVVAALLAAGRAGVPVTVAKSSPSVSDPRDTGNLGGYTSAYTSTYPYGTGSRPVTAGVNSAATVSDPRDGAATVT